MLNMNVSYINIFTTCVSIWQNQRNRENQKATAPTKVGCFFDM